ESVLAGTRIGADRLVLAASGTHSGPGHFFSAGVFNRVSADQLEDGPPAPSLRSHFSAPFRWPKTVFDPDLENALIGGISNAVIEADGNRRQARAQWGRRNVNGVAGSRLPGGGERSDVLTMLRVDVKTDEGWVAAGALSIFGMHGSGYPPVNDLLDGDIQGRVSWLVERETTGSDGRPFVHLMANGTLGDASPGAARERGSRCGAPTLVRSFRPKGPQGRPPVDVWRPLAANVAHDCLAAARQEVDDAVGLLANSVRDLLATLGSSMRQTDNSAPSMTVARSFQAVRLPSASVGARSLCGDASLGVAFALGPGDGRSRYADFRRLGLGGVRYAGSTIPDAADPCPGREVLPWSIELPPGSYPDMAQLQVLRIGGMLVGVTPAAVTRAAGQTMTDAMEDQARYMGLPSDTLLGPVLIGLANGYVLYATTQAEYENQSYEGAATLYGVNTAAVLSDRLRRLVEDYGSTGTPNPSPEVPELTGLEPGDSFRQVPVSSRVWDQLEADPSSIREPSEAKCEVVGSEGRAKLVFEWRDAHPGALMPSQQTLLRIDASGQSVEDDDPALEVRVSLDPNVAGQSWEAVWILPDVVEQAFRGGLPVTFGGRSFSTITVTVPARTIEVPDRTIERQGVTVQLPEIVRDCVWTGGEASQR
ncbi:MAG: neutral/alkaline non-lysosomal ceramidase N-terminal domain-containing protein, partial [Longimicrobiales bacterium]